MEGLPRMDTSASPAAQAVAAVDAAITSRRSVRAFLPDPVPRQAIEAILRVAGRAPSGTNTQPWKVDVLTGPDHVLRCHARGKQALVTVAKHQLRDLDRS